MKILWALLKGLLNAKRLEIQERCSFVKEVKRFKAFQHFLVFLKKFQKIRMAK